MSEERVKRYALTVVIIASSIDELITKQAAIQAQVGVLGTDHPREISGRESRAIILPELFPAT